MEVRDSTGKVVRSNAVNVKVTKNLLAFSVLAGASETQASVGSKITLIGSAGGGNRKCTYSYLVHNKDTNQWSRLTSAFVVSNTYVWTAGSKGNREFFVEAKDSTGKVVRSQAVNVSIK